ncbi:hypothetical protein Tco_0726623 [Tanacetum coccineum]|uniref:Uncharacterized protein n=1 Tax=Tanacetum coccineum TaxID=301880 RepID=A0ABQ4YH03_9ASTR
MQWRLCPMPHESPFHSVQSLGYDEGSLSLSELTVLCSARRKKDPTELVEDQGSGEKGEKEVSTVGAEHSTVIPEVSTAAENLVYIRKSVEKKKDKG